jgi:hypothetical protein
VQSESPPLDNALSIKTDTETDQRLAAVKRVSVSAILQQQEANIRTELEKLNLSSNSKETVDILIQHLAVSQLFYAAERLYRQIFGSQISILKHMNLFGLMTRDEIKGFYDEAAAKFPVLYPNYSFDAYIQFPTQSKSYNDCRRYPLQHHTFWKRIFAMDGFARRFGG